MARPVLTIVPYDSSWPALFALEAQALRAAFGSVALRVEHVGSTAVPGLAAKPIIDIQISVTSLVPFAPLAAVLERLGYRHIPLGEFDSVYPYFAKPPEWPSTHHVHLCEVHGEQEARHLAFRDYLRSHPVECEAYARLKRGLAATNTGATLEDRERYSLAKSAHVEAVLAKARMAGYYRSNAPAA